MMYLLRMSAVMELRTLQASKLTPNRIYSFASYLAIASYLKSMQIYTYACN